MKKAFFAIGIGAFLLMAQSCAKCGRCVVETTVGAVTTTTKGNVVCGNGANESGSYYKAAKLNCEKQADDFKANNPNFTGTITSTWTDAK